MFKQMVEEFLSVAVLLAIVLMAVALLCGRG